MINSLRRRFVIFSVIVISSIIIVVAFFIYLGSPGDSPIHRYIPSVSIGIVMVFIGSWLLSKIAIRPIKTAWQRQLDFTADASHELRTPITVIQTNLELVMDSPGETVESQMRWLENIGAENMRMAKLVDDLLTLSRADTDQQALEVETFMFDDILFEAIQPFEPLAHEKNIDVEINANEKVSIVGDRKRIKQLVLILVDNAIKYTDSGSITVSLSRSEKEIVLTVSDTGCGIGAEHQDKIFDRFYRVTETRNLNQDGSGLGLSIAKWIVQEHGGTIAVSSALGVGTVFTASFPDKR